MEIAFHWLLVSLGVWVFMLGAIRGVGYCGLRPWVFAPVLVACLAVWPLPIAVALGYTISLTSPMFEYEPAWYVVSLAGNLMLLLWVFLCLPDPVTADGTAQRPVVLWRGSSWRLQAAVHAFLVLAPLPARMHYNYRSVTCAINYVGKVALLSGLRRLVGGAFTLQPWVALSGALYVFTGVFSQSAYARERFVYTRMAVEGPGLYAAVPVAYLMMLVDDRVWLETHQWVWSGLALGLACLLQLRPTRWFWRVGPRHEPDLRWRYVAVHPRF